MITPGAWLGLLGGGQLGRMFCMAAQSMGYRVAVLDPNDESPAGGVADRHIRGDYLDREALSTLAQLCEGVTTEFENVPAESLAFLRQHCRVSPQPESVAIAQDRIQEKQFLVRNGFSVAPFVIIGEPSNSEIDPALLPGIVKTSRLGYDGKGQSRAETFGEAIEAATRFAQPCILEQIVPLHCELSVIVGRQDDGSAVSYPVAENEHRQGILNQSIVPARITDSLAAEASMIGHDVAQALDYCGVLCVELFLLTDERLLVNEIAPRPHNSGHYSIDACITSQFEQQVRILCGLPLGDASYLTPSVMVNLLGDAWYVDGTLRTPDWNRVLSLPKTKLHLYGKREARPGRKMGHLTCLGATLEEALATARGARARLGID